GRDVGGARGGRPRRQGARHARGGHDRAGCLALLERQQRWPWRARDPGGRAYEAGHRHQRGQPDRGDLVTLDRSEIARALAKAIAYKQCGKQAEAAAWARQLVELLECAEILQPTASLPAEYSL